MTEASLFFVVVNRGKANALLHKAQELGVSGGTVMLGEGTVQSRFFDLLGINETLKEVLLMAVPDALSDHIFTMLKTQFQLHKRFKGIAFSVPYRQWLPGTQQKPPQHDRDSLPYTCLMTVVEKGQGADCMAIARAAGAQGGTIIRARGAGVPKEFYFPLVIEPQKDLVLIVTQSSLSRSIKRAIFSGMGLHRPGSGIIFALPVLNTIGLYEERRQGVKA